MNMLTSLKAMLFSSTAVGASASAPTPATSTADFAALLNGSMAEAMPAGDPAALPSVEAVTAVEEIPIGQPAADPAVDKVKVSAGDKAPDAVHSNGLAIAVAAGKASGAPLSMPPGLALGLAKRAAALAPGEPIPSEPTVGAPAEEAATPAAGIGPDEDAQASPELAMREPPKSSKAPRAPRPAEVAVADFVPLKAQATDSGEPVSDQQDEPKPETAEQPQPPLAAAAIIPLSDMPPPAIAVETPANSTPPPARPPLVNLPVQAGQQAVLEPQSMSQPSEQAAAVLPAQEVSAPAKAGPAKRASERVANAAKASPVESPRINPANNNIPVDAQPMKSEVLALLQLVREQTGAHQSGTPARLGQDVSALVSKRAEGKRDSPEAAAVAVTQAPTADLPQAAPVPSTPVAAPSPASPAASPVDLSASLNSQVVDMGVSGQWIDGLARDIAGLSAHGAQGRFQINADQLGPVQVDIRQGSDGAAVHLTVASEAAEMALRQDSDRFKLDAALSAVRISEVKIDRAASVSEPARADTAGQQSSQQQSQQSSGQGAAAWANNGQNMGQSQGQQGRWRAGENNGIAAKSSGDPAVLNHVQERQDASDSRRARYA